MKKFLLILFSFAFFTSAYSVNAQTPTDADGFFGKYFQRMVKDCKEQSEYHAVTGFALNPFGTIICTDIRQILNKIPAGPITVGSGVVPVSGAQTTIQGPVASSTSVIDDNASGNTLVTKEYVDENFSQVAGGSVIGDPGQIVTVEFNKRFKVAPVVIAVIENFQYDQRERVCWWVPPRKKFLGKWNNKAGYEQCEDRAVPVNIDFGAKVLPGVTNEKAQIQISPKLSGKSAVSIRWIAISSQSPFVPFFSALTPPSSVVSNDEYAKQREEEARKRNEELDQEAELLEQEIKKNSVPSKAIMPFYANVCPDGWLPANGQNGTPDLRWEFIRGLDNGRGVDNGRTLGSFQDWAIENIIGHFDWNGDDDQWHAWNKGGAFYNSWQRVGGANGAEWWNVIKFDASRVVKTSHETRPRNVALLYCMKQ